VEAKIDIEKKEQFSCDMLPNLSGRTALITGGNRGIGKTIAMSLGCAGAKVAIAARSTDLNDRVREELEEAGITNFVAACDVRQADTLQQFMSLATEKLGHIDILVNNAGIYRTQAVRSHSLEVWQEIIDTNLTGAFIATRSVLDKMIEQKWGRIINISSISGKVAEPYGAAYSASKFGMIGLTQAVALEVARYGITVNAVCPGWVLTDLARAQLTDEEWCRKNDINPEESLDIARLSVPQERFLQSDEIAALVAYLASDAARGITGQAINVCGGSSLH
jgi:3-hydroxybutyrate dehydrogenase